MECLLAWFVAGRCRCGNDGFSFGRGLICGSEVSCSSALADHLIYGALKHSIVVTRYVSEQNTYSSELYAV